MQNIKILGIKSAKKWTTSVGFGAFLETPFVNGTGFVFESGRD